MTSLTLRSASTPVTDQTFTQTQIAINRPAGVVENDLLDATFVTFIAAPGTQTHTLPSGWSVAVSGTFQILGAAYNARITRAYKIAGSSEPASYTFQASNAGVLTLAMNAYDNPDTVNPLNVASAVSTFSATTAISAPSVTTTRLNALVTGACLSDGGDGSLTTYTSGALTERADGSSLWVGDVLQASAGASGAKSITASRSGTGAVVTVAYNSKTILPQLMSQYYG